MMTHTKGPWVAELMGENNQYWSVGTKEDSDGFSEQIAVIDGYVYLTEIKDTARLIAAAPDLLEALEAVLPWASKAVADHYNEAIGKRALDKAHVAIVKAKGKTNEADN